MEKKLYFDNENYTGNHLHLDNYKNQYTPYVEAIAWERIDTTMDVFFTDFEDEEFKAIYGDKEHYYNDFMGVFLGNVKTNKEAFELFHNWLDTMLFPHRNQTK